MDYDDIIMEILTSAKNKNRRAMSTDTLSYATGLDPRIVERRLPQLGKFGMVQRKATKKVDYWGI